MKPVKVLAICASPRKNGNSKVLLDAAVAGLSACRFPTEVTAYSFYGKTIHSCTACLQCYKNGGKCILRDDFEDLRQLWLAADCVIYSLPVYVAGIPGQLKCFLDRLHNATSHYFPIASPRHMKAVACLSQGCELYGGQELAVLDIMRHAALINSIYVAPDGSFISSSAWCGGMEKDLLAGKQERSADDYAISLQTAGSAACRATELAAILREGVSGLREQLRCDPRYLPYLTRNEF